jgi:hypothetical protein
MQASTGGGGVEANPRLPSPTWQRLGPGQEPDEVAAGDLVFRTSVHDGICLAIIGGQWLRSETRAHARWNHVMLVLDADGRTAHATARGLVEGQLSALRDSTYALVHFDCSDEDRAQVVAYAEHMLGKHPTWGWWIAGSQLFSLLTGSRVVFGKLGTITCSGFAAEALLRTGAIFDRPAALMSPADLAKECGLPGVVRSRDVVPAARRISVVLKRPGARLAPGGSGRP